MAPAAAAILRDEYDAVLLALVDGTRRARGDTGRIQAVVADARQVLHEEVVELERDVLRDLLEVDVLAGRLAVGEVVLPVRAPLDLHALTRDERARAGNRLMVAALGVDESLVVVRPRLVVIVHLRLVRMIEELQQALRLRAGAQRELAIFAELPAALPLLLVFPVLRIADARLRLDIVEIHVFRAFAVGPDILASDGARMAANALIKIHDHGNLCFNLQASQPPPASCARRRTCRAGCPSGRSS